MTETIRVNFNGETVERSARRMHVKPDGLTYAWVSLGGRDVKVVRQKRKRIFTPVD